MQYGNLHTHSVFSDGTHTLEENIRSALEKNMASLGFSDHSFTPCDPSYCMHLEQYAPYRQELQRLKAKYADRLPVYTGMELDAYSELPGEGYDYLIASVHYLIPGEQWYPIDHSLQDQENCIRQGYGGDVLAMAQAYYDLLCWNVERSKPDLIGHFDVITKFSLIPEEDPRYRRMAAAALERMLAVCPYVELNTGAISRGWRKTPYPGSYLFDTVKACGGHFVLGSDSHNKDNLIFGFDQAVADLRQAGFDHIARFQGSGYEMVAL